MIKNILIIFAVAVVSMLSYFIEPQNWGHDTIYHYGNVTEIKEQIMTNPPFGSPIVGNIGNDFGYGTRLFYPPLGHTSIAIIDLLINNMEISFKIFNFLIVFLSGVSMYYLSKKISKNDKVGVISAVIYMLFPYHLVDIFIRDALAESLIFVFIPLVLNGIYSLFYENGKNFYLLFILGYVLMILSHANMTLYFTFLIFIFLIIKIKKVFTRKIFFKLLIGSIFILLITSFFWVPLLQHNLLNSYMVFKEGVMVQGTQWNGLFLYEFFDFYNTHNNELRFYIDVVVIGLLIFSLYKYIKIREYNKFYLYVIILGLVSMTMATVNFPWDLLPLSLRIIQFPWRMVTYVALFVSIFAPICLKDCKNIVYYGVIILLCISSYFNFNSFINNPLNGHMDYEIAMGWQKEYLPINTYLNIDYFNNRTNLIKIDSGSSIILEDEMPYLKFEITEPATVELPRLFYLGYSLKNVNGEVFEIYENENGFIESSLDEGTYILDYTYTTLHKLSIIVSILSVLVLGGLKWKKLV